MKKLLVMVVVLSLSTVACEAFKDSYGDGSANAAGSSGSVVGVDASGNQVLLDFATDETECIAVEGVTVAMAEESGVVLETMLASAEEGAEVAATAEKLGDYTTKISVTSGEDVLSFVLKQTADAEYSVCSVSYKEMTVSSGEITIDSFNMASEDKMINAGAFKFEFAAAEGDAISTIKELVSADAGTLLEGTYYAEELADAAVVTEETATEETATEETAKTE